MKSVRCCALEPLRITATLETGRVATIDGGLPLDSIMAAAWMRRHKPDMFLNNPAGRCCGDELIHPELPLRRRELAGEWFWACSFGQYQSRGEGIDYSHKRFDADAAAKWVDFGGRRGKIHVSSGYYKNYRHPIVYLLTPEIIWYAVGDAAEVQSLLVTITAIGKRIAIGYGTIADWRVEPYPIDLSCHDQAGRSMRALPDPDGPRLAGIRPPYWHPANMTRCVMPPPGGYSDIDTNIDRYAELEYLAAQPQRGG